MGDGWVSMNDVLSAAEREATEDEVRRRTMGYDRNGDRERYPCDLCGEVWMDPDSLDRHRRSAHLNVLAGHGVACGVGDCTFELEDNGRAGIHRRRVHGVSAAEARARGLTGPTRVEARNAIANPVDGIACGVEGCNVKLKSNAGRASHRWYVHGIVREPDRPGSVVDRILADEPDDEGDDDMPTPDTSATNGEPVQVLPMFQCDHCGRKFATNANLGTHRYNAHGVRGASKRARGEDGQVQVAFTPKELDRLIDILQQHPIDIGQIMQQATDEEIERVHDITALYLKLKVAR